MSDFGEQHQVQTGSRKTTPNRKFAYDADSEVARRRFDPFRTWNAQTSGSRLPVRSRQYLFQFLSYQYFRILYMMMFSEVARCRCRLKWIGRAWKHCRYHWDYDGIVLRRQILTTSGIHPPSWTSAWRKSRIRLAYIPVKSLPPETIRYKHWNCVAICFLC